MSVWVVAKDHIDLLVAAIERERVCDPDTGQSFTDLTALGRELWAENVASVRYRYGDSVTSREVRQYETALEGYEFERCPEPNGPWAAGEVVGFAVASFECQSCEHPAWEGSRARRIVRALRDVAPLSPNPASRASMLGWHFTRDQVIA